MAIWCTSPNGGIRSNGLMCGEVTSAAPTKSTLARFLALRAPTASDDATIGPLLLCGDARLAGEGISGTLIGVLPTPSPTGAECSCEQRMAQVRE